MSTCALTGTILTGSEVAVTGALIFAVPAMSPAVTSTGYAIYPEPVQTVTSTGGVFTLNLIKNMYFVVTIPYLGFRSKIRVPNEDTYNLFSTTTVTVVTDPTPNDESGESGNAENPDW